MTQDTETERVKREDFEQWSINTNQGYNLTRNQTGCMRTYEHDKTEHAWRGYFHGFQSARRAPVVPDGWRLVPIEPTMEMVHAGDRSRKAASWLIGGANGVPATYSAMLAAAPQPLEGSQSTFQTEYGLMSENRTTKTGSVSNATFAETVELPEPQAEVEVRSMKTYLDLSIHEWRDTLPDGVYKIYTEQQVRALLSSQSKGN